MLVNRKRSLRLANIDVSGRTGSCFEHSLSWLCRESDVQGESRIPLQLRYQRRTTVESKSGTHFRVDNPIDQPTCLPQMKVYIGQDSI